MKAREENWLLGTFLLISTQTIDFSSSSFDSNKWHGFVSSRSVPLDSEQLQRILLVGRCECFKYAPSCSTAPFLSTGNDYIKLTLIATQAWDGVRENEVYETLAAKEEKYTRVSRVTSLKKDFTFFWNSPFFPYRLQTFIFPRNNSSSMEF